MYFRARHRQITPLRHVTKMNSSHACRKKIYSITFSDLTSDAPTSVRGARGRRLRGQSGRDASIVAASTSGVKRFPSSCIDARAVSLRHHGTNSSRPAATFDELLDHNLSASLRNVRPGDVIRCPDDPTFSGREKVSQADRNTGTLTSSSRPTRRLSGRRLAGPLQPVVRHLHALAFGLR